MSNMGETMKTNRGITLLFASCFYIVVGIYLLIFSLGRAVDLWILIILNIASIIAGVGLFMLKRWSFWLAIAVSPLLITVAASTLAFSTQSRLSWILTFRRAHPPASLLKYFESKSEIFNCPSDCLRIRQPLPYSRNSSVWNN